MWMRPPRKVPTVSTTAAARNSSPIWVRTPTTRSPSAGGLEQQVIDGLLEQPQVRLASTAVRTACR
jgi:hypothetical protein